eukprot:TRINITY_DN86_c0_g2_i1.p1 TRINITY_DN86_c0_g2~~TRINITY_DN86_c0_g2_i1.p1  ORF type:complete len:108 (+),score=13.09 TRINITY_DN86_c0_g2_i1:321-644(+)
MNLLLLSLFLSSRVDNGEDDDGDVNGCEERIHEIERRLRCLVAVPSHGGNAAKEASHDCGCLQRALRDARPNRLCELLVVAEEIERADVDDEIVYHRHRDGKARSHG